MLCNISFCKNYNQNQLAIRNKETLMKLLDGKKTAAAIKDEIATEVEALKNLGRKAPHLAAVLVGINGASLTYVNAKVKACQQIGYESTLIKLPETTSEETLLSEIKKLNQDPEIDGFIVQLPLPQHIDEQKILMAVNPSKDVDGFHPTNVGKMMLELPTFIPATPFGILELLERYQVKTEGKNVVVIGRSHIVGRPMGVLMSQKRPCGNATVTVMHSKSKNLEETCQNADIIIAALGKPKFLKENMVKEGAVVVDVGITRVEDPSKKSGFRLIGDVDFENVAPKCSYITPVPGGVGPMTIAMLLKNTMKAAKKRG